MFDYSKATLGSRGYFFLIDTDGWRRSYVNEEKNNFIFFLVNATSPPAISIDKKKISSGTQGILRHTKVNDSLSSLPLSLENFKMATPVRNRPIMHCKPLSIEYFMYVHGLCLLFDFATKNLHFATIFYHLVDKCDLRILLISSPG